MKSVLNNFNNFLCRILSMDNSQWSRQIFPSGLKKKVLLNGPKMPALHNKEKENSNTGDNIKERKNILEINKKVFDDTEKNIKLIQILERLQEKRRISQESNPPREDTSNKEKKTLNIQKHEPSDLRNSSLFTVNTHISSSRRNKIISKLLYDIVKEAIEEVSVKEYLANNVMVINNLKERSKTKANVQNEGADMVDTLLRTPSQYRNNNTLHFNQSTNNSNIDKPLNNCTNTPSAISQSKRLYTTNTSIKEISKTNNINKIINILIPKLEETVTTFQIIETKQNTVLNLLLIQLQEKCSKTNNTNTKLINPVVHADEEVESLDQNSTKENTDTLLESNIAKDDCKEEKNVRAKNIHNEPPLYFKKFNEISILPECTIWNAHIKSPIKINCNSLSKRIKSQFYFAKKYRYETKEVASPKGDKIKITCLVTDDEVNIQ
ncbi:hypothetical protein ILUMI_09538 [Ignelater luminosus]|uniref:Uncharacterized protein n=1 Tax=Ignelater luminosus TaxID=2038154 RepID=A0A8K0D8Y5_IGNLU|nr:hypothetical protein ILUMI_09538 [Ignelater luminosus]